MILAENGQPVSVCDAIVVVKLRSWTAVLAALSFPVPFQTNLQIAPLLVYLLHADVHGLNVDAQIGRHSTLNRSGFQ